MHEMCCCNAAREPAISIAAALSSISTTFGAERYSTRRALAGCSHTRNRRTALTYS
jgi:hypothetical protein